MKLSWFVILAQRMFKKKIQQLTFKTVLVIHTIGLRDVSCKPSVSREAEGAPAVSVAAQWHNEDLVHASHRVLVSHKKDKIMPFAATWLDPETVRVSEVRQGQMPHAVTCMLDLNKNGANELTYKTESQMQKANLW